MTERPPDYGTRPEVALQRAVVKRLRQAGWLVVITAQDRATRGQVAGLPDLLCFRRDTVVLLELKAPGGVLRRSQVEFITAVAPHLGAHVIHRVIYAVEQVDFMCEAERESE